ncbi:helix-turn-helix domain-containing protein [Halovenus sp. HT40]|uniref:helix-turn-helix domain-containing protein n=1 Tax=Halovenus sp. HT40 TaxID=3126691 RepID=UPI00300EC3CB
MTLIAEYTLQTPLLLEALESTPEMMIQIETLHTDSGGASKVMFWAWGDDFQTFERSMAADSIISEYNCLTEFNDQRLYRIIPSEQGEKVFTYRIMAEHDIVSLHEIGNYEGLTIRARFPGRNALTAYRDFCQEQELTFQLQNIYPEEQHDADGEIHDLHGLTPSQREVLQTCLKQGYFAIPRQITLEEIADELDVSVQAVSTRLRRALQRLLQNTIDQ